jgi:hypothetical protein
MKPSSIHIVPDHHTKQLYVFKDGVTVLHIKCDNFYAKTLDTKTSSKKVKKYKISTNQESK